MKVLVTGACGQLGRCLSDILIKAKNLEAEYTDIAEGFEYLDITDPAAVRRFVLSRGIEAVVNCAGYTNVEKAEEEPEVAERINAAAVSALASAMKEVGGLMIHISTDYIFDGRAHEPYPEDAPARPLGAYARSKWHGEQALVNSGARYVLLRTAWLYSEYGRNFVKTMLRLTAEKPSLKVVDDQRGTPTCAGDLAAVIVHFLEVAPRVDHKVYNYTNEGECTWYEFARTIASYAGHTACDIQPCRSDEFPSKVHRPAYSVLSKEKIKRELEISIPHWKDSLRKCLEKLQ